MANIKIYIDRNAFFLNCLQSSQKGFDVCKMMKSLAQADKDCPLDTTKATQIDPTHDTASLFPCIIVVKNVLERIKEWKKAENNYMKMLKRIQQIHKSLPDENKQGLWKTYSEYVEKEIKRVGDLRNKLESFYDRANMNLKNVFGFFNNSSIWVRLVDWDKDKINDAKKELEHFNEIGLYNYLSAKENLNYNIRIQEHNYLLSSTNGHGNHVTPILYGNETEARETLKNM